MSILRIAIAITLIGCAPAATPAPAVEEPPPVDVRVPIPEADPRYVDVVTTDVVLEPGREAIYCYYHDNNAGRFGTDRLVFGDALARHHVALRHATQRRPHGTLEDCTHDQQDLQLGDLFTGADLPAGWAAEIPADAQLVVEMHYQNATDVPVVAREVVRLRRVQEAEVAHWVRVLHMKSYDLVVPPGEVALAFECTAPTAATLYEHWGHLHAAGRRFEVELTRPGEDPAPLYAVTWGTGPLVHGSLSEPISIPAGTRFRVTCEWSNTTGRTLRFPEEMCAFGGIVEGAELSCAAAARPR